MTSVGLLSNLDLKRKKKVQEVEEGKIVPPKGAKQPKNAKDKRASSANSREDSLGAEVCRSQRIWAPQLELNGAAIL